MSNARSSRSLNADADTCHAPSSDAARGRICTATAAICVESSVAAATMHAIAQRAQVSQATMYRLWPSRTELLIDAVASLLARPAPRPHGLAFDTELAQTTIALTEALRRSVGSCYVELHLHLSPGPLRRHLYNHTLLPWRHQMAQIWSDGLAASQFTTDVEHSTAVDHLITVALVATVAPPHAAARHISIAMTALSRRHPPTLGSVRP
ncbi:transcriptional regulator, TetR family [Williamsia maris]|uniref:Transcriptional regulator, TetR family n=2 Tax=Williamsia maris TaxID=72806 RepID=A0ABT1HJH4_9NOCA|nr:transcriptional regulator, TetR family [Williamsia maris]